MPPRSQLILVDDHPLFRTGLAVVLAREPDLEVVGEAGSGAEAVELARRASSDVVVLDVLMPGTTGISLASQLLEINPESKILALSVLDDPKMIATMLRAGARGYALKTQPPQEITQAIRVVREGGRYVPPGVSREAINAFLDGTAEQPLKRLTQREREIFELLIRGHSNDDVAKRLCIARRTVETHRQRIMKKLATHSMVDMVRLAARLGALSE